MLRPTNKQKFEKRLQFISKQVLNLLATRKVEIEEKDKIIHQLEDEDDYSTDESDDNKEDQNIKQGMLIGRGHFGKEFQVREGMEKEAISLRNEWKCQQK